MAEALQICPNDHPPFPAVCAGFATALEVLGYSATTVYLAPARGGVEAPGRRYVSRRALPALAATGPFAVVLTHRYKGYRAGCAVDSRAQISLAHDFGMLRGWRRRLAARLGRKRVAFAAVSTAVAEDLARDAGRPCATLPNPIDHAALREGLLDRAEARRALGLAAEGYHIGVVGRLHWWKRPAFAVEGFQRALAALGNDAQLVFVGSGEEAQRLRHGPNVVLAGFVPEARRCLRAFDVVLSTSTAREAFGMSLVEALAADVPVVCADQPGPREATGGCARYFDGNDPDALAAALVAARREGDSAAAGHRHVVRNLSPDATAERLRKLLPALP